MTYTTGPYNKFNDTEQWIRITDGCPNQCEYCYAPAQLKYYGIPMIVRNNVKIMDMTYSNGLKSVVSDYGTTGNPSQKIGNFTQTKMGGFS